ncbi:hypothetical protein BOX15_Mlig000059g2 [Macrostomum lignano]|uniref:EF-hand domain-containing protein n=1 Tax=Macrostomum lignano TaxID=282301 RepID=A0A267GRZ6_9PLAT|nr:hypothetical protein BOX15_Mlig000059g2 [Macrostomum lignano]
MSNAELQAMLAEKAKELFDVCDIEQKGFITKRDMQRLSGVLPLDPDQIEDVFDRLDDDGNGYLTLEEFTGGFGSFMGLASGSGDGATGGGGGGEADGEYIEEGRRGRRGFGEMGDDDGYSVEEDEHFHQTMEKLGAAGVFQEDQYDTRTFGEDSVKELWGRLQRDYPELVPGLESLLTKMTTEIQKSQESYKSLEKVLRTKSSAHDDEVRKLYEEMETQIRAERDKVLAEERAKEKQLREDMEREIREKEKLCQELMKNHEKLQQRLDEINLVQAETAQENERLAKERDALEEELSESREALEESQSYVEELQKKFKDDRRKRAQAAIALSEGIALERETLVRQLDTLRDVNKKLKDESDMSGTLDSGDRGLGFGEIVHFREGGEEGSSGGGSGSQKDSPTGGAAAKSFNRQESLQGLNAASAVIVGGETLADIMDGDEDDCEYDYDGDAGAFGGAGGGFGRGSPIVYETIESESYQPVNLVPPVPPPPPPKETSETATMMTPCPSRQPTPPPTPPPLPPPVSKCEMEIQTEEIELPTPVVPVVVKDSEANADSGVDRPTPEGAGDEDAHSVATTGANSSEAAMLAGKSPERIFKVVFVGDSGVGKSSIIHRFCQNSFKSTFSATIGIDFQIKTMCVEEQVIALQLWDTAGQERFRSITKQYFRKADGIVIVYDVTNSVTYLHLREWMESVVEGAEDNAVKMVLGNKVDLAGEASSDGMQNVVDKKSGSQLADEFEALFYEVSAKSGSSINEAFHALACVLREREDRELKNAIRISADIEKKKGCCGK